jgi:hypothetical protein
VKLSADQDFDGALFVTACLGQRALHELFIKSHGKYHFHGMRIGQV